MVQRTTDPNSKDCRPYKKHGYPRLINHHENNEAQNRGKRHFDETSMTIQKRGKVGLLQLYIYMYIYNEKFHMATCFDLQ
jgi:hypothetical protein